MADGERFDRIEQQPPRRVGRDLARRVPETACAHGSDGALPRGEPA
jgi:hypothetical protein